MKRCSVRRYNFLNCFEDLMFCINIRMNQGIFAAKEKFIEDLEEKFHKKVKNFTSDASKISYVDTALYRVTHMYLFFSLFGRSEGSQTFCCKREVIR